MSRKTLSPTRRGVAGLTALVLATGTVGTLLVGTSSAVGPVITITSAKVGNPDTVAAKTAPQINAAGAYDGTGNAVHIVGSNFPATPTVTFDAARATSVLRLSDKLLVAKAPAKAVGTTDDAVDIVVGEIDGAPNESADVTLTNGYTYKAVPQLTDAAYSTDLKTLNITGTNLADVRDLQLGAKPVKIKAAQATATKISIRVPSGLAKAKYSISATSPWGTGTLAPAWNVVPAPRSVLSATPTVTGRHVAVRAADSITPGTFVKITGTALSSVDSIAFGHAPADFVVSSDTEVFVQVPAMAATQTADTTTPVKNNTVTVPIVIKNGSLTPLRPLKFIYQLAPIVTGLTTTTVNNNAIAATNTVVTVTGQNLKGTKLYFGSAKGAKNIAAQSTSTATTATYLMPKTASTGFALATPYDVWIVSKGGNLNTGRRLQVGS